MYPHPPVTRIQGGDEDAALAGSGVTVLVLVDAIVSLFLDKMSSTCE